MSIFDDVKSVPEDNGTTPTQVDPCTMGQAHSGAANFVGSQPNVFGGENIFADGHFAGFTMPNVFGGHAYHTAGGQIAGFTTPNVFGGHDVHAMSGAVVAHTMPNMLGSYNVHG